MHLSFMLHEQEVQVQPTLSPKPHIRARTGCWTTSRLRDQDRQHNRTQSPSTSDLTCRPCCYPRSSRSVAPQVIEGVWGERFGSQMMVLGIFDRCARWEPGDPSKGEVEEEAAALDEQHTLCARRYPKPPPVVLQNPHS